MEENFFDETSLCDITNIAKIYILTNRANNTRLPSYAMQRVLFEKAMKPTKQLGVSREIPGKQMIILPMFLVICEIGLKYITPRY